MQFIPLLFNGTLQMHPQRPNAKHYMHTCIRTKIPVPVKQVCKITFHLFNKSAVFVLKAHKYTKGIKKETKTTHPSSICFSLGNLMVTSYNSWTPPVSTLCSTWQRVLVGALALNYEVPLEDNDPGAKEPATYIPKWLIVWPYIQAYRNLEL